MYDSLCHEHETTWSFDQQLKRLTIFLPLLMKYYKNTAVIVSLGPRTGQFDAGLLVK